MQKPSPPNEMRMRPVYCWRIQDAPEDFIARLKALVSFDPAVDIQSGSKHATLKIPDEAVHTWSPVLDIQAYEDRGATQVYARMGPQPHIWTMFIFGYAASAVPAIIGTVYGMVQFNIGQTPWGLAALPAGIFVWANLYLASFVGKGLGADQIHRLLAVLEANLDVDAQEVDD